MTHDVESITPYGAGKKAEQIETMFDSIAPAYDFMNRAMTLGIDMLWRRKAVRLVAKTRPRQLLDVATGTGDFAIALLRGTGASHVTGIDLSNGMLEVARRKAAKCGVGDKLTLTQADCLNMPFEPGSFDAVTVAFGVRNFEHLEQGYREMLRVLRTGGVLCVLELSTPRNRFTRFFYDLYTMHIIPFVGRLKSGDSEAYRYLPRSIAAVPQREEMTQLMSEAGFRDAMFSSMTFGTCTIYTAKKPSDQDRENGNA